MTTGPANPLEVRMARLEGSYEQTNLRLTNLEGNLNRLEDKLEARFSHLDRKIDARFNVLAWLSGRLGLVIVTLQVLATLDVP